MAHFADSDALFGEVEYGDWADEAGDLDSRFGFGPKEGTEVFEGAGAQANHRASESGRIGVGAGSSLWRHGAYFDERELRRILIDGIASRLDGASYGLRQTAAEPNALLGFALLRGAGEDAFEVSCVLGRWHR